MQYWVVGAMFGGNEDNLATFIRRGYWYCWDPRRNQEIPQSVASRFPQIQIGDRIAAKRLLGAGSKEIEIRALGIVTDVDCNEWRVYVNWVVPVLARRVPLHGCAGSLHGPYEESDGWVREVFQL
ncbi:hypothetical protein [Pseudomonas indica]|jgi:hypothetical protein|uniref:hypothetical protein n=1 Tax=Pseudomonas indica TaxID=137658 RepID=UPI0023FA0D2B|nr:hypothetical protein [Pseudomonas indica]MBU3055801.1 hypothetical protein [Pseudomonas indica]